MRKRDSGSALVEALIGSAIVAMTLGTMYRAVTDSAARNRMAEEKRFATLIAQSELATVGTIVPVQPADRAVPTDSATNDAAPRAEFAVPPRSRWRRSPARPAAC